MTWYLLRLLPPRPDFAATMNDEEMAVMGRHVAYWRGHRGAGAALAFGPVDDPAGDWGMAVVRAAGLDAVRALQDADPAVLAGVGRYETLELPGLVTNG